MNEFVDAYIKFLHGFKEIERPLMPKFNVFAYTESEYLNVVKELNEDYEFIDDLNITEHFLKGD